MYHTYLTRNVEDPTQNRNWIFHLQSTITYQNWNISYLNLIDRIIQILKPIFINITYIFLILLYTQFWNAFFHSNRLFQMHLKIDVKYEKLAGKPNQNNWTSFVQTIDMFMVASISKTFNKIGSWLLHLPLLLHFPLDNW